jgi:hypothetical protein
MKLVMIQMEKKTKKHTKGNHAQNLVEKRKIMHAWAEVLVL